MRHAINKAKNDRKQGTQSHTAKAPFSLPSLSRTIFQALSLISPSRLVKFISEFSIQKASPPPPTLHEMPDVDKELHAEQNCSPSFISLPFHFGVCPLANNSLPFKPPSGISEAQISSLVLNRALVVSLINYDIPPKELSLVPSTL